MSVLTSQNEPIRCWSSTARFENGSGEVGVASLADSWMGGAGGQWDSASFGEVIHCVARTVSRSGIGSCMADE